MKILGSTKLDFDDVLIRPKTSETASRKEVQIVRDFPKFPNSPRKLVCVPIMASNMDTTGTFEMALSLANRRWITCLHKHYPVAELIEFFLTDDNSPKLSLIPHVWLSIGMSDIDLNKLRIFITHAGFCPNLCVDVANGYTDNFVERVAQIRTVSPESIILAGNVATSEQVERLIRQGKADIIKLGIGPGSVCTTRLVTGVGYPQLSATLECSDAAHGSQHGYVCTDGGCRTSGDICKAFGANADFVMLGSMLSGTDECDGEWEYEQGFPKFVHDAEASQRLNTCIDGIVFGEKRKARLKYYGMSSYTAQDKYNGKSTYRASEGKVVYVDYKGPVEDICQQIEGGIRSCCAYIGAKRIKDIGRCTTFVLVNRTHNTYYETTEESLWTKN